VRHIIGGIAGIGKGGTTFNQRRANVGTTSAAACHQPLIAVALVALADHAGGYKSHQHRGRKPAAVPRLALRIGADLPLFGRIDAQQADPLARHLKRITIDHTRGTRQRFSPQRGRQHNQNEK
jgi:hypothetical protein